MSHKWLPVSGNKSSIESVSQVGFGINVYFLTSLKNVGNSEFISSALVLIFLY